jgi:hypothetical protein
MAISVVNGYLCMNSCDAAKARTGQNPRASTNGSSSGTDNQSSNTGTNAAGVVYGGALAGFNGRNSATASTSANAGTPAASSVDVLA